MNALELIRELCSTFGIPRPNSIIGSSDTGVRQLLALLNKAGRNLAKRPTWQALTRECEHTTLAAEDQGALSDIIEDANAFAWIVNESMFNRDRIEPIHGPDTATQWQMQKAFTTSGPFSRYRIRGNHLYFLPAPEAGESVFFEYVTKNWVTSSDGTEQRSRVTDDEDIFLLDDDLLILSVDWRWRRAKGMTYAEEFNECEAEIVNALAKDGTKKTLSTAGGSNSGERVMAVPPGGWQL